MNGNGCFNFYGWCMAQFLLSVSGRVRECGKVWEMSKKPVSSDLCSKAMNNK